MDKMKFRQVHLDFHTSPDIAGIGEKFDKKQFQDMLRLGHVDSITLFSKCHHGYSFHPTKVNVMHPGLKFDLLGAQMEACREIGVRTAVYVSAGFDEKYAFEHPDCVVRFTPSYPVDFLSSARYHCLCFNTPYLDLLIAQIREVMENYHPEEIFLDICDIRPCFCNHCIAAKRKAGVDPHNEAAAMVYGREVYYKYADAVERAVHDIDPCCAVFHNAGRLPMDDRKFISYDTHLELEGLPTGGWGYDHFPMTASYSRSLGKEYLGMTGKFHRPWGEFGGYKHPNALRYETSLSLAFGAKCSIGDQLHPTGYMDPSTYALIGAAYAEVEKKEPWCRDVRAVSDIAVLAHRPPVGANRVLLEKKYLFDIIDKFCDVDKYKLIVLPDRVPYDGDLAEKLRRYLANGGKILATGNSCFDGDGRFLGLDCLKITGQNENKPNYMRPLSGAGFTNGAADYLMNTDSFLFEADGSFEDFAFEEDSYFNRTADHFCSHAHSPRDPASQRRGAVISGNIGYICWKVFQDYAEAGSLHLKELAAAMIERLTGGERTLTVKGLPDRGVVTLNEQPAENRLINHLLFSHTSVRGENVEIIEDVVPVFNVEVAVKTGRPPKAVVMQPQGEHIPFKYEDGAVSYTVPKLEMHQMIAIEF